MPVLTKCFDFIPPTVRLLFFLVRHSLPSTLRQALFYFSFSLLLWSKVQSFLWAITNSIVIQNVLIWIGYLVEPCICIPCDPKELAVSNRPMTSPSKQSNRADSRSASLNPVGLFSFRRPVRSLTIAFWIWKAIIFLAVVACPGPGYDTSTTLLPNQATGTLDVTSRIKHADSLSLPLRFVRWDSIYYVDVAENGYVFEQEWAFGYGYTKVLRLLSLSMHARLDIYPLC